MLDKLERQLLTEAKLSDLYTQYALDNKEIEYYNDLIKEKPFLQRYMPLLLRWERKQGIDMSPIEYYLEVFEDNKNNPALVNKDITSKAYERFEDFKNVMKSLPKWYDKIDIAKTIKDGLIKFKNDSFLVIETSDYFAVTLGSYASSCYFTYNPRRYNDYLRLEKKAHQHGWCIGNPSSRYHYDSQFTGGVAVLVQPKTGFEESKVYIYKGPDEACRIWDVTNSSTYEDPINFKDVLDNDKRIQALVKLRVMYYDLPNELISLTLLGGKNVLFKPKSLLDMINEKYELGLTEEEREFLVFTHGNNTGYIKNILQVKEKQYYFKWLYSDLPTLLAEELYRASHLTIKTKLFLAKSFSKESNTINTFCKEIREFGISIFDLLDEESSYYSRITLANFISEIADNLSISRGDDLAKLYQLYTDMASKHIPTDTIFKLVPGLLKASVRYATDFFSFILEEDLKAEEYQEALSLLTPTDPYEKNIILLNNEGITTALAELGLRYKDNLSKEEITNLDVEDLLVKIDNNIRIIKNTIEFYVDGRTEKLRVFMYLVKIANVDVIPANHMPLLTMWNGEKWETLKEFLLALNDKNREAFLTKYREMFEKGTASTLYKESLDNMLFFFPYLDELIGDDETRRLNIWESMIAQLGSSLAAIGKTVMLHLFTEEKISEKTHELISYVLGQRFRGDNFKAAYEYCSMIVWAATQAEKILPGFSANDYTLRSFFRDAHTSLFGTKEEVLSFMLTCDNYDRTNLSILKELSTNFFIQLMTRYKHIFNNASSPYASLLGLKGLLKDEDKMLEYIGKNGIPRSLAYVTSEEDLAIFEKFKNFNLQFSRDMFVSNRDALIPNLDVLIVWLQLLGKDDVHDADLQTFVQRLAQPETINLMRESWVFKNIEAYPQIRGFFTMAIGYNLVYAPSFWSRVNAMNIEGMAKVAKDNDFPRNMWSKMFGVTQAIKTEDDFFEHAKDLENYLINYFEKMKPIIGKISHSYNVWEDKQTARKLLRFADWIVTNYDVSIAGLFSTFFNNYTMTQISPIIARLEKAKIINKGLALWLPLEILEDRKALKLIDPILPMLFTSEGHFIISANDFANCFKGFGAEDVVKAAQEGTLKELNNNRVYWESTSLVTTNGVIIKEYAIADGAANYKYVISSGGGKAFPITSVNSRNGELYLVALHSIYNSEKVVFKIRINDTNPIVLWYPAENSAISREAYEAIKEKLNPIIDDLLSTFKEQRDNLTLLNNIFALINEGKDNLINWLRIIYYPIVKDVIKSILENATFSPAKTADIINALIGDNATDVYNSDAFFDYTLKTITPETIHEQITNGLTITDNEYLAAIKKGFCPSNNDADVGDVFSRLYDKEERERTKTLLKKIFSVENIADIDINSITDPNSRDAISWLVTEITSYES